MKAQNKNIQDNKADVPEHFFREIDIEFLMHELKGPIAVIEAGMKIMLKKQEKFGSLPPGQKAIVERALRNSIKARRIIYALLEIGRSEANCFECRCFILSQSLYPCILESLEASGHNVYDQYLNTDDKHSFIETIK